MTSRPVTAEPTAEPTAETRRARAAVATWFVVNGALYSAAIPRLPEFKAAFDLSNTSYGLALAALPVGSLLAGLVANRTVARFGSGRTAVVGVVVAAAAIAAVGWTPTVGVAAFVGAMAVLGAADATTDVAMNAHGLRVQRTYGRSIINSFHALWSLGAVVGGVTGAAAAGARVPLSIHLTVSAAALVAGTLATTRWRLRGPDDAGRHDSADHAGILRLLRHPALWLAGLTAVAAAVIEDTPASWGAVYLGGVLGASALVAGLGFVSFQAAMMVGRSAADRLVDRWGPIRVARVGATAAAIAMAAALLTSSVPATVVAFAVAGLGSAALFPLSFHAAGSTPGIATGDGVAVMSLIARTGFLAAPPVVGLLADVAGLRAALLVMPAAAVVVILLARGLDPAPRR